MMPGQRSPKTRPTTLWSRCRNRDQPSCHGHAISFITLAAVENNKDIIKIKVHDELNIYFLFQGK